MKKICCFLFILVLGMSLTQGRTFRRIRGDFFLPRKEFSDLGIPEENIDSLEKLVTKFPPQKRGIIVDRILESIRLIKDLSEVLPADYLTYFIIPGLEQMDQTDRFLEILEEIEGFFSPTSRDLDSMGKVILALIQALFSQSQEIIKIGDRGLKTLEEILHDLDQTKELKETILKEAVQIYCHGLLPLKVRARSRELVAEITRILDNLCNQGSFNLFHYLSVFL